MPSGLVRFSQRKSASQMEAAAACHMPAKHNRSDKKAFFMSGILYIRRNTTRRVTGLLIS